MFNRKLVNVLCYIVAVLLIAKALLMMVMFVWQFFGTPPVQMFDMRLEPVVRSILFVQELGTTVFFYLLVTALKYYSCCACAPAKTAPKKKA